MPSNQDNILDQLSTDITDTVGNIDINELEDINSYFNKSLKEALKTFNSTTFDDDGFIKRMRDMNLDNKDDKETMKNVLNNIKSDYVNADILNQSELLLRRDIFNTCTQMPELLETVNVIRDSIIECNVATGEVSRTLLFENKDDSDLLETQVRELEERHELLLAIKNFIIPKALMHGETYIQVIPYAKLFAELEAIHEDKYGNDSGNKNKITYATSFKESVPTSVSESFTESFSLLNEENLKTLMESAAPITKVDSSDIKSIYKESSNSQKDPNLIKNDLSRILDSINICNGSSVLLAESGEEGFKEFIFNEYKKTGGYKKSNSFINFNEADMDFNGITSSIFKNVDQDGINFSSYNDIKGCYIKYLDGLKLVPIRMDRRVVGYYYITTTMDLQNNPVNPNGIIDLSYQNYVRDRNMVDSLTNIIIKSFNKKMLEKNIQLKNEIADIIIAHKFAEGKLNFIYIPENEVVRLVLNEDENGKGHSILEPSLFNARMYLMLTMYNMIFTLNNSTTRVHYLKSSGLNKDYKSQIQRTIRKFQQRRITIDDIYSYSGVLNKIGGMSEMVLPEGRNGFKAIETDTIPAVDIPFNMEFLEQQHRQAINGTGAPFLLVTNAIDEVDFAKTLEMANTRLISRVSSYKIDSNRALTKLYRKVMKYSTDIDDEDINAFKFKFNAVKQQELNITAEMIQNYNQIFETIRDMSYTKKDMEDENGNPTYKQVLLRRKVAEMTLPDIDYDRIDKMLEEIELKSREYELQDRVKNVQISDEEIDKVSNKPNE